MTLTEQAIPRIQSVGAPPELHADRVMAEMLRHIVANQTARWDDVTRIFNEARGYDGNPTEQKRLVEKLKIAGGEFFFGVDLEPGKRGKYTINIFDVSGFDPLTNETITHVEEIPEKPWLVCTMTKFCSQGRGVYDAQSLRHLIVTHHAASRLAQRCQARGPEDVIAAVGSIWRRFIEVMSDQPRGRRLPDDHRMRVKLEHDMGECYAVLRRNNESDTTTVVTILGPDGL